SSDLTQALSGGLLFAVIHYLVLDDADHPLAQLWVQEVRRPGSVERFEDEFESFIIEREAALVARASSHPGAQLNEINRCSYLLPALATVWGDRGHDLALVDLGASAGLILNFDRYCYDYGSRRCGALSPVVVEAQVRGRR